MPFRFVIAALIWLMAMPVSAQTVTTTTLRVATAMDACAWSSPLDEPTLRAVQVRIARGARGRAVLTFERSTPELTRCMTRAMLRVTRARWTRGDVTLTPFATLDLPLDPMPRAPTAPDTMFATGFSLANSDAQRMAQLQALATNGLGFSVRFVPQVLQAFRDKRTAALLICRIAVGADVYAVVSAALTTRDRPWLLQQTRGRCGFAEYAR